MTRINASYQERLKAFQNLLQNHQRIVFFGGAGVSTESDIPDFRGTHGIFNRDTGTPYSAEEMVSHHFYVEHPEEFFSNYKVRQGMMKDVQPNRAHIMLAKLEKLGKLQAIITQNIDGLHQRAGSQTVYELHGSIHRNYCTKCHASYSIDEIIERSNPIPHCDKCGGIIKPDVVLFEEPLDNDTVSHAIQAIREADMLIIGGTSLVVWPAAGFIHEFGGDAVVLINQDSTPRDQAADILFRESIGQVLEDAISPLLI